MRTALLVFLLSLARVAAAAPADELLERGLRSYAVGRYDEAIAAFQRGYEIDARPDLLYALGQAQRMKGDCKAAAASYRAYLRTAPPERSAAPARQNLERCVEQSSPSPSPSPSPPDERALVAAAPAAAPSSDAAPPPRRWHRDRAAAALVAVGAITLAGGGALWGVGEAGARSLAQATRYDQFAAHAADADLFGRERLAGIVLVAVGGALVTTAVARWIWVARRR